MRQAPRSTLFPYTTLFRSHCFTSKTDSCSPGRSIQPGRNSSERLDESQMASETDPHGPHRPRSEEHTSELQSHSELVCRLLLEKKKRPTTCGIIQRSRGLR